MLQRSKDGIRGSVMLKAHGTSSLVQRTTRVVFGTGHHRKLVPCWLMSSEINPGQFWSRMCREQLRSEQVLPEASRPGRLAYDPERNTLQASRREKRTSWGAWLAVQRRSSEGAGMTGQRGRLEKLMPDKTGLSDVTGAPRAAHVIRGANRYMRQPIIAPVIDSVGQSIQKSCPDRLRPTT